MCDQTELKYTDGDIVWVKFHNFWWPGEVHGESKLPPGLLKSFRRMPVAVVKFFQENAYEYVKTINDIYSYNCIRKHEFIKKGLDLHRAKKRNMEKFPEDVRIAEEKTGGDPDIIESEEFQPEQKPNIANIFGDQTPKMKKGFGRGRRKATPSDEELTYSRTKNLSLKAAHATPTLSTPKSYAASSLAMQRTPATASTSTPNPNEFQCHLCNFSTTRLNVIVLHNKTHASETKVEPQPTAKAKKTPVSTPVKRSPGRPRGRKQKQKLIEPIPVDIDSDSASEEHLTQAASDSESERKKMAKKTTAKVAPKKRQTKPKLPEPAINIDDNEDIDDIDDIDDIEEVEVIDSYVKEVVTPVPKAKNVRKTARATRKKNILKEVIIEIEKLPEQPIEIKSTLLADWSEDEDESMVSTSKEITSELEDIKSVVSSPNQSSDEKQPKQAIRNIPKKDRRGIILDEFYTKQVPSTNETDTEGEQTAKEETVVIESDDEICDISVDLPKEAEVGSTSEERSNTPDVEIIETDIIDSDEVVESTTDNDDTKEISAKEGKDEETYEEKEEEEKEKEKEKEKEEDVTVEIKEEEIDLLKRGADLLEETSLLQKNIEIAGIIDKKRRLLNKHKTDDEFDGNENAQSSSIEEINESHTQSDEKSDEKLEEKLDEKLDEKMDEQMDQQMDEQMDEQQNDSPVVADEHPEEQKPKARRRSSSRTQISIVTKTYRSNSRRKTKSSSSDEKGQLQSNEKDEISVKGNGMEDILPKIEEDCEIKLAESTISNDQIDTENEMKMEVDDISTVKSELDLCKTEVDCFDFKEEEEEVPQTLNRRKRRCLPPGKVFEMQTIDKLEEIRKQEENEKSKRLKLESEDNIISTDDIKNTSFDESSTPEKLNEKQLMKDDDVKDSKTLPPKERGKRIFKSRNRSRLSEGDSISNDEKSPNKDTNQSFDSIEKSAADSTIESPKISENVPVKIEFESVPIMEEINSTVKTEHINEEINSTLSSEESRIESEVANTLITMTNSPIKVAESFVTSSDKDVTDSDANDSTLAKAIDSPKKESPMKTTIAIAPKLEEIVLPNSSSEDNKSLDEETPIELDPEPEQQPEQEAEPEPVVEAEPIEECIVTNTPPAEKRKSVEQEEVSDNNRIIINIVQPSKPVKTQIIVESSAQNVNKRVIVAESSGHARDDGDGLLIKSNPNVTIPKPVLHEVSASAVSSTSTSTSPQQQQKKPTRTSRKKVPVTIGYQLDGTPIVTYRLPSDKPIVHLPSHIQTPDMVQSVNPALLHTAKANSSQFVITSKGALLKTTSTTTHSQTTSTTMSGRSLNQMVRPTASTSYSQIKSPPMPTIHVQTHQSINPHLIHKQPTMMHRSNQQIQKQQYIQHQIQAGQMKQKIATNVIQHPQPTVQKTNVQRTPSRPNKKQQELLIRKQQESVIAAQSLADDSQPTEVLQNAEDNQLLAVPAENFDGPAGAFFLCRVTENNLYTPIDNQPLYLDEKNQLIPGSLINAGVQEELIEETLVPQVAQQFEYQQEQIVQTAEEPSNLKYLLNVDGQQILLDQQSLLQLTSGGEMQQLVTADGQRLILQGSAQDILAAIQSNQQEQIIIPEDMIEEDPNNHDILAAALEDTGVFPHEQYIGDVLQIQTGNSIEVEPLAFQTINQAATSETNAILPPIMSTVEQASKTGLSSPSVDCSNLDESLAVIGVSVASTNVPTSLELPITVTNPAIAPKTTNAITTIYPSNVPTTIPPLQASQMSPITSELLNAPLTINSRLAKSTIIRSTMAGANSVSQTVFIQDDDNCEIVPNTPESVIINHGYTSDNSNSSEIPLQSNIILRQPSIESMERDEDEDVDGDNVDGEDEDGDEDDDENRDRTRRAHNNSHEQKSQQTEHTENSRTDVVDSLILNENSFDHHDAALLLANSRPGFQAITIDNNHEENTSRTNRNSRRNRIRHRNTNHSNVMPASNDHEPHIYIIEEHMIGNSEYDTDDVANIEHFNS